MCSEAVLRVVRELSLFSERLQLARCTNICSWVGGVLAVVPATPSLTWKAEAAASPPCPREAAARTSPGPARRIAVSAQSPLPPVPSACAWLLVTMCHNSTSAVHRLVTVTPTPLKLLRGGVEVRSLSHLTPFHREIGSKSCVARSALPALQMRALDCHISAAKHRPPHT
jgi:hypothetical protein